MYLATKHCCHVLVFLALATRWKTSSRTSSAKWLVQLRAGSFSFVTRLVRCLRVENLALNKGGGVFAVCAD